MTDSNVKRDRLKEYLEQFKSDWEADEENRERRIDDLEFVSGDAQWNPEEKRLRELDGRPCLTINRLPQFIRQVVGDLRNVRPSIKVRPYGNGSDEERADIYNGLIRNIEQRSKDEQPYTSSVENAVRCGIGHFRIVAESLQNNPFSQDVFLKPIRNPNAVVWDGASRSITRADAKRVFIRASLAEKKFKKDHPEADVLDFGDVEASNPDWLWASDRHVIVSEMYEVTESSAPFILLEDGSILRRDRMPFSARLNELDGSVLFLDGTEKFIEETREGPVNKILWRKMTGADILEDGEWITQDIPVIPVIGEEIHFEKTKITAGLIRHAKDPQRLYNFWRSAQAEIIGASPKAPYIVGSSQISGFEKVWGDANKGQKPFLPYDDTKNPSRPQREVPPVPSSGMNNEIALAAEDMKATTGIFDASLGAKSNEQSGVAIRQRQQEGDVSTNFFGDNLAASMRRAGKIMVDLIPLIYDAQRIVRIVKEDDTSEDVEINQLIVEEGIPKIFNDLTSGDYDVSVDIGPSYSTRRQEAIEGMVQLLQGNPALTINFLDIIARRSDWPGADEFAERAKKLLPPQLQEEDEEITPEEQAAREQATVMEKIEQQMLFAKAQSDLAEQQAKTSKIGAEIEESKAQTNQTILENAMKRLELSDASGQLRSAVEQIVALALAQPPPTAITDQTNSANPPQSGFFNV